MAAESNELIWDHAGEKLDDTSPLLTDDYHHHSFRSSRNESGVKLSQYETLQLIQNLEDTRDILCTYLNEVSNLDDRNSESSTRENGWRRYICQKCKSLIRTVTGTKAVVFTVVLQAINILIQTVVDFLPHNTTNEVLYPSAATMIFLQLANLLLVLITSANLARQMFKHQISGLFLLQSYLATILLFAGIYTITKRLKPLSWKSLREDVYDPVYIAVIYCKFLYFSVSMGTLCGNTDVTPFDWYNCVFVSIQMLISFMYFASILGHACLPLQTARRDELLSSLRAPRTRLGHESRAVITSRQEERMAGSKCRNYGSTTVQEVEDAD